MDFLGSRTINIDNSQNNPPQNLIVPSPTPEFDVNKLRASIGTLETGGVKGNAYTTSQPSGSRFLGNALGKYRVTEGELKTYAQRYLGRPVSSQQFLVNPQLQDAYMKGKLNYLSNQGNTPAEILAKHRGGQNATVNQYRNYVQKGLELYGK